MLWNEEGEKLYIAVREPDGYNGKIKTTLWGTWPTFESWNWNGHEGKTIEVEVYSRYPKVRLYQNGNLVEEKDVNEMKATFTVDYAPGKIVAEGIDAGKVMETVSLETAGAVSDLKLKADRYEINADGRDLAFITIECIDSEGRLVPTADNFLTVTTDGHLALLGLGNADIKDEDPYFDNTHRAWKGRALAVVRNDGETGNSTIKVSAKTKNGEILSREIVIKSKK